MKDHFFAYKIPSPLCSIELGDPLFSFSSFPISVSFKQMRLTIKTPSPYPTKTFTCKPRCITMTLPAKHLQLSNDTTPQTTLPLDKMIDLQHHNDFPYFHLSSSSSSSSSSSLNQKTKKLGKKWKDYQGMSNWEGLLDPLDHHLRAEILRYGHFVEAAYKSFEFDPSSPNYANSMFPKSTLFERCDLPNTGYKVTKHLRATSGIQLPSWVDKAPSWVATQSSYVGYVAVCDNKEEIKRLGRRDVVVAFRGTTTCLEWLENFRATLTNLPTPCNNNDTFEETKGMEKNVAMVESGFLSLYTSSNSSFMSLQDMVRQEIRRVLETYEGEPLSLTVTGHSLGAALAILTAYTVKTTFPKLPVTVMSFGGPRVGNRSFRLQLEKQGMKVLRIVNSDDVITKVPGFVFDDDDVASGGGFNVAGLPSWIQKRVEEAQWMYDEVGKELRLCSKDSPYLGTMNVATCHELHTYLHLVDGFVSSTCPFRASAKRFLSQ